MNKIVSALVTVIAIGCFSSAAHAKGIPLVYQTGEDIFVAGDGSLPAELKESPELAGFQSGYRCDVFALMFAYFSVSDCKPVVFKGDTYGEDTEISTAVQKLHPESSINLGLWGGYGKFPLGLGILLGVGLVGYGFFSKDDDEEEEESQTPAAS